MLLGRFELSDRDWTHQINVIESEHAGQGVGLALLRALEAAARCVGLDQLQLAASLNAVSFYRQAGYTSVSSGEFALNETQSLGFERMKKRITVAV
ncbi:MAG: GNAT family N-acetyltransferase [Xanthomonadales bacterium]|nr:GNAT family N-acetyltransferase [Xanthomonadales bacterium]